MKGVCLVCGKEFETLRPNRKYCSHKCKAKRDNHRHYTARREQHKTKYDAYRKEHPERMRKYAAKKRRLHRETIAESSHRRQVERQEWVFGIKSSLKCAHCSESRPMCLDFHHLDGSVKEYNISTMLAKHHPKDRILAEIAKCIVLCRNCHAIEHWENGRHEYKST